MMMMMRLIAFVCVGIIMTLITGWDAAELTDFSSVNNNNDGEVRGLKKHASPESGNILQCLLLPYSVIRNSSS